MVAIEAVVGFRTSLWELKGDRKKKLNIRDVDQQSTGTSLRRTGLSAIIRKTEKVHTRVLGVTG